MSRSVRRVALDFQWPLEKVWSGYLNPHYDLREKCADCNGDGGSDAWRLVHALWYRHLHHRAQAILNRHTFPAPLVAFAEQVLQDAPTYRGGNGTHGGWGYHLDQGDVDALVKAGRLWDFTRRPLNAEQETFANGWTKEANGHRPSAEEVNTWATKGMGHDSLNAAVCVRARLKRYRVSSYCPTCHGKGYVADRSISAKIARWRKTEPPAGEGWQLWETVSEGSPVSPVFGTAEALATWLSCHYKGMGWKSRETWLRFIESEHPESVSFVVSKGVLMDGIDAITHMGGCMRLPEGWRQKVNNDGWFHGDAQAFLNPGDATVFAAVYAPDRSTTAEAEADLERMVWALEGSDPRARVVGLETWNAALAEEVEKANTRADLSDKALDYARKEIADLRAKIDGMEARERRRHPVIRKIAHALYVLRGSE